MERIRVVPREGLSVPRPHPDRGHLDAAGEEVPLTRYWRRRLADGDVERAPKPAPKRTGKEG